METCGGFLLLLWFEGPAGVSKKFDEHCAHADARFRKLLVSTDKRVWESAPGDPFWDFGYPANASGELLEDLRSEGLA